MTTATASSGGQSWIFPPPGAAFPSLAATSNFGPVRLQDFMVLDWQPETNPEIWQVCVSKSGIYSQYLISKLATAPLKIQFLEKAAQLGEDDQIFCHIYFWPSGTGNTVVWEFINIPAASPSTWAASSAATSTVFSSSQVTSTAIPAYSTAASSLLSSPSSPSSPSLQSSPSFPSSLSSSSSSSTVASIPTSNSAPISVSSAYGANTSLSTPTSSHRDISDGAGIGIGIGVGIFVVAIGAAIAILLWKRRQSIAAAARPPRVEETTGPEESGTLEMQQPYTYHVPMVMEQPMDMYGAKVVAEFPK